MNCTSRRRFDEAIVELARGASVRAEVAREVEHHLAVCDRCAAVLRRERLVTSGLRGLAGMAAGAGASHATRERVLAAFAARQERQPAAWSFSPAWLAAAAALILASIGSGWAAWHVRTPRPQLAAGGAPLTHGERVLEGFIPLPAAGGMPDLESGYIVRVDLPVGALPAFGIEFIPDPGSIQVQADLVVGQDGQPRAIRLVLDEQNSRSGP
jgi:hypothetical protein